MTETLERTTQVFAAAEALPDDDKRRLIERLEGLLAPSASQRAFDTWLADHPDVQQAIRNAHEGVNLVERPRYRRQHAS
jgi:hypothetical protein